MCALRLLPALCFVAVLATPLAASADQAAASVVVSAQFNSRTSLQVSSRLLQFDVANPAEPAVASVDFSAGARTATGAEVVLSVEAERALDGPGGAADVETSMSFAGQGEGTLQGRVDAHAPSIAGRWNGSGRRAGRIVFSLRAAAAGTYAVPVRFVLSTP
jgi:hypothetical protein